MRFIQRKFWKKRRRPFLLLEVLIALMLVSLCLFPLLYPHVGMVKEERKLSTQFKIDRAMNLAYSTIVERLYQNEIPWSAIEKEEALPIVSAELEERGFQAVCQITETDRKKGTPPRYYLLKMTLQLLSASDQQEKKLDEQEYILFVEKLPRSVGEKEDEGETTSTT